jgi:hypothetical protein
LEVASKNEKVKLFVEELLKREPGDRLGSGGKEQRKHSDFNGFEWKLIGIETEGKCADVENIRLPRRICGLQTQ